MQTELAPAKVRLSDELGRLPERWYCVSSGGLATLCNSEYDARAEVLQQAFNYPRAAPYRAMVLGDVSAERERYAKLCILVAARLCDVYGDDAECIATGDACAAAIRGKPGTSDPGVT